MTCLTGVGAWAAEPTQKLLFRGDDALQQLESMVVGPGITGVVAPDHVSIDGSRLIWQSYNDSTDELGIRHSFWQQVLLPGPALARQVGAPYATEGLLVRGGEVGVHIDTDGVPYAVFGRQAREVKIDALPAITNPTDAFDLAQQALQSREGFEAVGLSELAPEERAAAIGATRLVVRVVDERELRLVWEVATRDAAGLPYTAILDASTGAIVGLMAGAVGPVCGPRNPSAPVAAIVVPQNPTGGIYRGEVQADPIQGPDRPGWSHEADMSKVTRQLPQIDVYKYWPKSGSNWDPEACYHTEYGLLALNRRPPGGTFNPPQYADATTQGGEGVGSSAGDALWHTKLAMETLKAWFGWCGLDGSCTERANLVVDEPQVYSFGYAYLLLAGVPLAEAGSAPAVVVTQKGHGSRTYPYTGSASLDVMAHEWGHAVVKYSPAARFWQSGPARYQLDEGFANVFGHAVEWRNQAGGRRYERADWCFGEDHNTSSWPASPPTDCPQFWSRADRFVETVYSINWEAYWVLAGRSGDPYNYYSYHRDHDPMPLPPVRDQQADGHIKGHMLAVVLYLLSEGGLNPICPAAPGGGKPGGWTAGCNITVPALGVQDASRILMRILTRYAPPNTQWEDLADLGKLAAFDLHKICGLWLCPATNSALVEQMAVNDAFGAIGFQGDQVYRKCPPCPIVPPQP